MTQGGAPTAPLPKRDGASAERTGGASVVEAELGSLLEGGNGGRHELVREQDARLSVQMGISQIDQKLHMLSRVALVSIGLALVASVRSRAHTEFRVDMRRRDESDDGSDTCHFRGRGTVGSVSIK